MNAIHRPGIRFALLIALTLATVTAVAQNIDLSNITVPEGFKIEVYADNVRNARSMALSPGGILFVGTRSGARGTVFAVVDSDKDFKADEVVPIVKGLNMPNGVAFKDGALYVVEMTRVIRFDDIENTFRDDPEFTVVKDGLPEQDMHGWRYMAIGPDDKLYVALGTPCDACEPEYELGATITRMNLDGSDHEIIARGVRMSVGFDWHPETGDLWFSDNGCDKLGNDLPPDELNVLTEVGQHFGFPYWHGTNVPDPRLGVGHEADEFVLPVLDTDPHVAALGMRFYQGSMFPEEYKGQVFMAEHGATQISAEAKRTGYRVVLVKLDGDKAVSYEAFADGWAHDPDKPPTGRPVDVIEMPDGSLLVSDDAANCIYRITYGK